MRTTVTVRQAHKDGNDPGEYEDAWRVSGTAEGGPARVTLADGATMSFLAGRWARMLTSAFAAAEPAVTEDADAFARTAAAVAGQWPGELEEYVAGREAAANPLRWYERPGLERGGYATLLAVAVGPGGTWTAAAVGDTCLFQVRENRLLTAFPLTEASAFGDTPPLVGSNDTAPDGIAPLVALARGTVAPGDRLYAATDALAAWFLSRHEGGGRPWQVLDDLSEAFFETWLAEAREKDEIHNDDVTLVSISFGEGAV